MDKQLTQLEKEIVTTVASELRIRSPRERQAFIEGRISGLRMVLDLIKGQFMERINILKELAEKEVEHERLKNED